MENKGLDDSCLGDSGLLRELSYIDGRWVRADSGAVFAVLNPADGGMLGHVPDMGATEAQKAVEAAKAALPDWRALTAKQRSGLLKAWYGLVLDHADSLARLLTAEQGKPLAEAKGEILYGASFIEWFAEEAKRVYGETIPSHKADARVIVTREPVGVVAAITPWNFPHGMITRKVAPALAAGCTVVLKPAEDTPLSALALAVLAEKAGIPPGVLNIVTGSKAMAAEIGTVLTTHPEVRKVSFTGSTATGRLLMSQAADSVKKISLELGGNAPFIVFDSADLDLAVAGAMACKFRNAGQTCVCANRIYVQDGVYEDFAARLAEQVRALQVGPGTQDGVQIGPLINAAALEKVRDHVADAQQKGAQTVCGGAPHEAGPLFFAPTLMTEMDETMRLCREETFGPVAGLFRFKTEAEVIKAANDTSYGLASYLYSRDLGQAFRVSEALEYGMVGVNAPVLSAESIPFGGIKQSGIGREGGRQGIEEFTNLKYTLMGGLAG
ncbi:MAG: NAD-dependent succinate-semialdehyde dehydrogenase [Rhodospirillales bacterium]|nr:NAD-dependent succinate-semialdehyde dehydrogenase [Rhodospirillales bacterium]MCB9997093.1 NAD-dependent succinate-semialdehyde dehydrogenase [Rhodospirillales bacterium]